MYKLPKDFDGVFFIGRRLEFITFSENNVAFAFDKGVSVTVESSLQHQYEANNDSVVVQNVPINESRLMQLLSKTVAEVKGDEKGTLTILFNDGQVLKVFDDQPQFESYLMNDGKHEIIV